jgi:hypothetical protein
MQGTATVVTSGTAIMNHALCALSATTFLYVYALNAGSYLYGVVLTVSGSSVSVGTTANLGAISSTINTQYTLLPLSSTQALISFSGTSGYASVAVLTVAGTTVTSGTWYQPFGTVATSNGNGIGIAMLTATTFIAIYAAATMQAVVGTISGSTLSFGTVATSAISYFAGATGLNLAAVSATAAVTFVANASNALTGIVLTVSGLTVSIGSQQAFSGFSTTRSPSASAILADGTILVAETYANYVAAFSLSGSTLSLLGTVTAGTYNLKSLFKSTSNSIKLAGGATISEIQWSNGLLSAPYSITLGSVGGGPAVGGVLLAPISSSASLAIYMNTGAYATVINLLT